MASVRKKEKTPKGIWQLIEEEYLEHNDWDDDETFWLKEGLKNCLTPLERKIYLTYVEEGSYKAAAEQFKVTTPTLTRYVNELKGKLIDYVDTHIQSNSN